MKMKSRLTFVIAFCLCAILAGSVALIAWHRTMTREINDGLCAENLKRLAIALCQYHNQYRTYPPASVRGADGKPMYSWRVLILPYVDHQDFYDKYDFNQPWDAPVNQSLAASHPEIAREFQCPCDPGRQHGWTSYVAIVGPNTLWLGDRPLGKADLGNEARILLIERGNSCTHWTQPEDIDFATAVQENIALSPHAGFMHFVLANGAWGRLEEHSLRFRNRPSILMSEWASRNGTVPPDKPEGAEDHDK